MAYIKFKTKANLKKYKRNIDIVNYYLRGGGTGSI